MVELTESNWEDEVVRRDGLVLVQFWAPWSAPCRLLRPVVDRLAGFFGDKVTFGRLNVDENLSVAQAMRIMSIPDVLLFRAGRLVDRVAGQRTEEALSRLVYRALER